MELRARFAVLLLVAIMLPSRWLFPQEGTTKKPTESTAPEQTTGENTARFSKIHCELPSCVQKVIYFSNVTQPSDFQDVTNAMRTIAEISRVQQVPGARIIIVEGTAEQVAMAEKLAVEIDKDKRRFGGLGYRIDLKVQESESEKKAQTRLYSFLTEARDTAKVSAGRQATAKGQDGPASESKQPSDSGNARGVECRILAENEHTVELNVELTPANDSEREPGAPPPSLRIRQHVTVELDKPTVISRVDDPDDNRSFTIELTATRVKGRL
jgi:hypothetical protein